MQAQAQPVDGRKYLLAFLLAVVYVFVFEGIRPPGFDHDLGLLIPLALLLPALFVLLPERPQFNRTSLWLLLAGLGLGCAVFFVLYHDALDQIHVHTTNGVLGGILGAVTSGVIIPIYEEKVCRQVMFFGLGKYLNLWLSACIVSFVFALPHQRIEVFAFVFSLAMCALAVRGFNTFDRALLHGGVNLAQMALRWYFDTNP